MIVAALQAPEVRRLVETARELGMDALVEVHTEDELAIALEAGAELLGINNRNLHTFEVDVSTTERLIAALPPAGRPVVVSLSGLSDASSLAHLRAAGADAILVGEAIVTAPDPAAKVRELSSRGESPGA